MGAKKTSAAAHIFGMCVQEACTSAVLDTEVAASSDALATVEVQEAQPLSGAATAALGLVAAVTTLAAALL